MSTSFPNPSTGPLNTDDTANPLLREMQANQQADNGGLGVLQLQLNRRAALNRRPVLAASAIDQGVTDAYGYNEGRSLLSAGATPAAVVIVDAGSSLSVPAVSVLGDATPSPIVPAARQGAAGALAGVPVGETVAAAAPRPSSDFSLQQSQGPYTLNT